MLEPVPGPQGYPFLGNILDVRDEVPINGLIKLAEKYGPIYKINILGTEMVVVSSVKLLEELSDEARFHKVLPGGLEKVKGSKAPGLFTAASEDDPDWGQAHRILMPAFGPLAITDMFDEMYDVATQLILKWARKGPENRILATEDFTRLTLDTISLCAMDYRFNSFYSDEMHPFVEAMNRSLAAGNGSPTVFGILRTLVGAKDNNVVEARATEERIAGELVQKRKESSTEKKDLLNAMIKGKDPKTGEGMRDDLIISNMISFLVAGHETTSGLLSFTFVNLLKNPASLQAAQAEVDSVVGRGKIKLNHLKDFKYLSAVLREALRLNPTAPAFVRQIRPENKEAQPSLGGYAINRDWKVVALISKSGRDAEVYGEDANEFHPERMLDGKFESLPKSAWKPFGTGPRACIGRAFAWQEALLALALILQNFDLRLDDPHYEMRVKQALTVKPRDFYIRAAPRRGLDATIIQRALLSGDELPHLNGDHGPKTSEKTGDLTELLILFGSNTGTCQTLAQRLASEAERFGYVGKVVDMDSGITLIEDTKNAVIITASYEGQPPDNAVHFVEWLTTKASNLNLDSLHYAIFGCGHSDWTATFQKIPTLVDEKLEQAKGKRIVPRGFSDAAKGDTFSDFDEWADGSLWPTLTKSSGGIPKDGNTAVTKLDMEVKHGDRASQLRQDVQEAVVKETRLLTAHGETEKHHLEILLPSDMAYEPGDYLAVLPLNPDTNVQRVMTKYRIPWDATTVVKASGSTTFPTNTPMSVSSLLKGYVELAQPATKKGIRKLASTALDPSTEAALSSLAEEEYETTVLAKRTSILDLLIHYPNISLPFAEFLSILPPMRTRHYSISSSPLANPGTCTITYTLIDAPSLSGSGHFVGVAGSYLRSLQPSDTIQVAVRPTNKQFRLPLQVEKTPLLMFCAGTGLAPFRGFVQQRVELIKAGNTTLAPAILFLGCHSKTGDRLYAEELDHWSSPAVGAVDVRYAFSRDDHDDDHHNNVNVNVNGDKPSHHPNAHGCKHVQDRMMHDKEDIYDMWAKGAKIFVCGSPAMAKAIGDTARTLVRERLKEKGQEVEEEKLQEWFTSQRGERFVTDVFA